MDDEHHFRFDPPNVDSLGDVLDELELITTTTIIIVVEYDDDGVVAIAKQEGESVCRYHIGVSVIGVEFVCRVERSYINKI